jgi:hypothetical protein
MMRALTLTQPWCGLIASGIKLVENRPRSMIKREDFGKPFALHASREIDDEVYGRIAEIAPELLTVARNIDGGLDHFYTGDWYRLSRVTSAVIGVATIDRMVDDYDTLDPILGAQRRWYFGPVGYVLRDVRSLDTPVPCRGWQGFWTLQPDTERAVVAQISRAA